MTFAQPFSDYEVLDRVGAGSMGTVFKARHKKLNRVVALKVLKPSLARDTRYVDRLRREARIVASLNHPNIVTGYDLGQEGGYHFFVMEFIEGKSLRELLHEWGMFAEDRVLDVAVQITIALDHAFTKGVIHRDIKPANILIDNDNVVKLTDMGLAKGPDNLTITRDGATVGTPQYISPEQARSPQDVDVRSDLYSLGATLFHMCTGQPPFRAETMANVLIKVLDERAPSAAGFNPDLSDGLNLIIRKLLSKDPGKRYQTPAELLTDLERVQRSEAPAVDIDELDTGEEGDRRRAIVWGAAVAVPVLAFLLWLANRDDLDPVVPEANPRTEYRQHVLQNLRDNKIELIGDKLRRVRQLEIGNKVDHQLEVLASLRAGWHERLADDLPALFRAQHASGFESLGWFDEEKKLKDLLATRIKNEFGLEDKRLPGTAQEEYRKGWNNLSQELQRFLQTRNAVFIADVNARTQEILAGLDDELRVGNIVGADSNLGEALRGFGDFEGRPPLVQLPAHLKLLVESKREDAEKRGQGRIDRTEATLRTQFDKAMEDLDKLVSASDLDRFERELESGYPSQNFRPGANPWKSALRRLNQARATLVAKEAKATRTEFTKAIQITYRIAVGGDLEAAKAELKLYSHPRLAAHERLLDHATVVRSRLLKALSRRNRIRNVHTREGVVPIDVDVVRDGARIDLHVGGAKVPLALLNVRDLVQAVRGGDFVAGLQPGGERAGLALWYVLSRQKKDGIGDLLDDEWGELFRLDLLNDLDTSRPTPDSLAAYELLKSIRKNIADEDWAAALAAIEKLRVKHPDFAKKHFTELRRFGKQIAHATALIELTDRMNKKPRLPGTTIDVAQDLSVTVGLDVRKTRIPERNRRGWVQDFGGPVRYENEGPRLDEAREQTLIVPTLLDVDQPVTVALDLSFEEENRGRLLFVQCHGATIGLGLHRDGVVVVFPVDKGLDPVPDLSRVTRKARKAARNQHVVPGARHRFHFVMSKKRGATHAVLVRVFLDRDPLAPGARKAGSELAEIVVQRPANSASSLTITPLSPVRVHAVQFRGKG